MLFSFRECSATPQLAPPRKRLRERKVSRGPAEEWVAAAAALQVLEHSREFDRESLPAKSAWGPCQSALTFLKGWPAVRFSQVPRVSGRGKPLVLSGV